MTEEKIKELRKKFYKDCVDHHPDFLSDPAINMDWKTVFQWIVDNVIKAKEEVTGTVEMQLCPKCNGDGNLGRYNSPNTYSEVPVCDVCNGKKIIKKAVFNY